MSLLMTPGGPLLLAFFSPRDSKSDSKCDASVLISPYMSKETSNIYGWF